MKKEPFVTIFPSFKCNAVCEMCSVKARPDYEKKMPIEDVREILHAAKELKMTHLCISGGEPTIDEGYLHEIADEFHANGIAFTMMSNGYFASTPEKAKDFLGKLKGKGLMRLGLSFDEHHQKFVPAENVANAIEAAFHHGIGVKIQSVGHGSAWMPLGLIPHLRLKGFEAEFDPSRSKLSLGKIESFSMFTEIKLSKGGKSMTIECQAGTEERAGRAENNEKAFPPHDYDKCENPETGDVIFSPEGIHFCCKQWMLSTPSLDYSEVKGKGNVIKAALEIADKKFKPIWSEGCKRCIERRAKA